MRFEIASLSAARQALSTCGKRLNVVHAPATNPKSRRNGRPGWSFKDDDKPSRTAAVCALSLAWITIATMYLYPGVRRSMRRLSRLPFRYGL